MVLIFPAYDVGDSHYTTSIPFSSIAFAISSKVFFIVNKFSFNVDILFLLKIIYIIGPT